MDSIHQRFVVLSQRAFFREGSFTNRNVDDVGLIQVCTSILPALISVGQPWSHPMVTVPAFGLGIRPLGTQNLTQTAYNNAHHVRSCNNNGRSPAPAFVLNLGDKLVAANEVSACLASYPASHPLRVPEPLQSYQFRWAVQLHHGSAALHDGRRSLF